MGERGLDAESYFLCAMLNLGYRLVVDTHPFRQKTIRMSTSAEDRQKVDFIITSPRRRGKARPVVPLQLTLQSVRSKNNKRHKEKEELHRVGLVALFWSVPELGQEESLELLHQAGLGTPSALARFEELLDNVLTQFFQRRKDPKLLNRFGIESRDRPMISRLSGALTSGGRVAWKALHDAMSSLPAELRMRVVTIEHGGGSKEARIRRIRSVVQQALI